MRLRKISDYLKINGVNMPTPNGSAKISLNPLWSENSGRGSNGLYVGDIVAEKRKVVFSFSNLDEDMVRLIENNLTTFYTIDFVNPFNSQERLTIECYKPPREFTLVKVGKIGDFSLSCIER